MKLVNKAVQEGLREQNYQHHERKRRANNVIVRGMKEETGTTDAELVANLFDIMQASHSPKLFTRLGKVATLYTRTIEIVMAN